MALIPAVDASGRWAREPAESLASWTGPSWHVLILERGGAEMSLETAKAAVDFAFKAPAPGVALELEPAGGQREAWAAAAFAMAYAERKAEWSKRAVRFTARLRAAPSERQAELLSRHRAEIRLIAEASGAPLVPAGVNRVLLHVGQGARDARGWVRAIAAAGAASVLIEPASLDVGAFARFYRAAFDALAGAQPLFEERAAAFLSRRRPEIPGYDVLNELAYLPDGSVLSSERGPRLGDTRADLYHELKDSEVARACLAAALPDNQPLCQGCAYRAFCAVPPSRHWETQDTLWGRTTESAWCALHMAILDVIFAR